MEINPNLQSGLGPLDPSAATETRRTQEARSLAHGTGRLADHQSNPDADQVELSASASLELARNRKLEALEKAVSEGTYAPKAREIATGLVHEAILDTTEPK